MPLDQDELTITPDSPGTEETKSGERREILIAPPESSYDRYVALQLENQKLRRALRKVGAAFHDWRERALEYQAERDYYREQAQAGKDGET